MEEKLLYTAREVAELLSISERSLYNALKAGKIECTRVGGRVLRFSRAQVNDYIAAETHPRTKLTDLERRLLQEARNVLDYPKDPIALARLATFVQKAEELKGEGDPRYPY